VVGILVAALRATTIPPMISSIMVIWAPWILGLMQQPESHAGVEELDLLRPYSGGRPGPSSKLVFWSSLVQILTVGEGLVTLWRTAQGKSSRDGSMNCCGTPGSRRNSLSLG
jgi:hypothetical protein